MRKPNYRSILWGGLLAGSLDISSAFIFYYILRGSTPIQILQSVASGLLGAESYEAGAASAALGLFCHYLIAFTATVVYFAASLKLEFLWKQPYVSGPLYGIVVYLFMNLVVLPLSAFPHKTTFPSIGQWLIHMFCVGLPIALAIHHGRKKEIVKYQPMSWGSSFIVTLSTLVLLITSGTVRSESATGKAAFAGGCYWCVEEAFEKVEGVQSVTSGFMGSVEAVEILYDPDKLDYGKLLEVFWKNIDPMDSEGQFCDRGSKYTSAIFVYDDEQKKVAEASKAGVQTRLNRKIVTPVLAVQKFHPVKEDQQDYYKKNPSEYKEYKSECGREQRLRAIWN